MLSECLECGELPNGVSGIAKRGVGEYVELFFWL